MKVLVFVLFQVVLRMFMFYADIRDSKLPGFVGKEEHRVAVTLNELIELASDFGLTPSLCTKTEIFMCFRANISEYIDWKPTYRWCVLYRSATSIWCLN